MKRALLHDTHYKAVVFSKRVYSVMFVFRYIEMEEI